MKKYSFIYLLFILATFIVSFVAINLLGNTIPLHFGVDGKPDQFGSSYFILIFPAIISIILVAMILVAKFGKVSENYRKYLLLFGLLIAILFTVLEVLFALYAYNYVEEKTNSIEVGRYICLLMGFMFVVMGNFMPKIQKNRTLGFKTKWSLHNEVTWAKTHRFCGFAMVIAGLISMAVSFIFSEEVCFIILMSVLLVTFVSTFVYSYKVYKEEKAKE
jgi:uncharacterized membrane protein